jgi:hypothetical protein
MTTPSITIVEWDDLQKPAGLDAFRSAFVGDTAFGVIGIRGIPGYADARAAMFDSMSQLALDTEERNRVAAVRQTYPG